MSAPAITVPAETDGIVIATDLLSPESLLAVRIAWIIKKVRFLVNNNIHNIQAQSENLSDDEEEDDPSYLLTAGADFMSFAPSEMKTAALELNQASNAWTFELANTNAGFRTFVMRVKQRNSVIAAASANLESQKEGK